MVIKRLIIIKGNRMRTLEIGIGFYKVEGPNAKWDDKIIGRFTRGPYSHVELFVPELKKRYTSSGRAKGVVERPIRTRLELNLENTEVWDFIKIKVTEKELEKIIDFYNITKNCKYDWRGIFGFISPISDREDRYFCSEWVLLALIIAGPKELRNEIYKYNPAKTSPNRLFRILKEILENRSKNAN